MVNDRFIYFSDHERDAGGMKSPDHQQLMQVLNKLATNEKWQKMPRKKKESYGREENEDLSGWGNKSCSHFQQYFSSPFFQQYL